MSTLSLSISCAGVIGSTRTTASYSKTDYNVGGSSVSDTQTISSTPVALAIPAALADVGVVQIRNKSALQSVLLGTSGGDYPILLIKAETGEAGGIAAFEIAVGETIFAKTLSGTAEVEFVMVERVPTTTTTTTGAATTTTTTTAAPTTTTTTT